MSDGHAAAVDRPKAGKGALDEEVKRFLCLAAAVILGLVAYSLPIGSSLAGRKALGVTVFMLFMFVSQPIPLSATGVLGCLLFWVWAGIPLQKAFSGFYNDTPWFVLGALLLGMMAERTGLAKRLAYNIICRMGTSYASILAGMMVVNFLLTFIVPSGVAKTLILCAIAIGMIEAFGLSEGSNIGKGLVLAMTYQSGQFDKMIVAGASSILARGLIESMGKVELPWGLWFIAFVPMIVINILVQWWLIQRLFPPEKRTLEGGPAYCRAELKKLGPMTTGEIKALVIMGLAMLLWATDTFHHIKASVVGLAAGLVACLPLLGPLKKDDFTKANFPIVIFIATAMCLGNVMSETAVLNSLTNAMFKWMTPILHAGSALGGMLLYLYANAFHLFLANDNSLQAATMPGLMQFALKNGFNPRTLGLIWGFAGEGKVFIYQSAVLAVGYAFGYFTAKDLFKFGLCLTVLDSILILVFVPLYWPLLGLTFR